MPDQTKFIPLGDWARCAKCGSDTQCRSLTTGAPLCMACGTLKPFDLVDAIRKVMEANHAGVTRAEAEAWLRGRGHIA